MARTSGRGGYAVISGGDPTALTAPPAWAASTDYVIDNEVTIGAGADLRTVQCVTAHSSAALGLVNTAGVLSGPQLANWREVPNGALIALRNWSFSTTESTEEEDYVNESTSRTVGTSIATTGQLVVADNDEDGFDIAQRALIVQNQVTLELYTKGIGTGRPKYTGTARFTGESSAYSTTTQERTFDFGIQGSWVRTRQ